MTSTLVMDALFSGCKQVEEASRAGIGPKVGATARHSSCLVLQTIRSFVHRPFCQFVRYPFLDSVLGQLCFIERDAHSVAIHRVARTYDHSL